VISPQILLRFLALPVAMAAFLFAAQLAGDLVPRQVTPVRVASAP
jgi:hypothetical protein